MRMRYAFMLITLLSAIAVYAKEPSLFFCPELFQSPAGLEGRLLEAYSRALDQYRSSVSEEEFSKLLNDLLVKKDYFALPGDRTGTQAISEFLSKMKRAVDRNEFPGGAKVDRNEFELRLKTYLEERLGKIKAIEKVVDEATKKREGIRFTKKILRGHDDIVYVTKTNPNWTRALSAGRDGVILWDLETEKVIWKFDVKSVTNLQVNADWTQATGGAMGNKANLLYVFDLTTGKVVQESKWETSGVNFIRVKPDLTQSLNGTHENQLILRDVKTWTVVRKFEKQKDNFTSVEVNTDWTRALSTSWDGTVILWNLETGEILMTLKHPSGAFAVQTNREWTRAISIGGSEFVLWDLETGRQLQKFAGLSQGARSVEVNSDWTKVLASTGTGKFALWNLKTGKKLRTFDGGGAWFTFVQANHDFTQALSGSRDGEFVVWDLKTGKVIRKFGGGVSVREAHANSDWTQALGEMSDETIAIWDLQILEGGD